MRVFFTSYSVLSENFCLNRRCVVFLLSIDIDFRSRTCYNQRRDLDFISFSGGIAMIRKKISRRTFLAALPAAALVLAGCSSGKRGGTSESTLVSRNETASDSKVDTAAPSIASRKVLLVNYPSHSTLKLLDPDGTEICSLESCDFSVPVCKDGKFPIRKKEKFGYSDIDGNILLEPVYDYPPSYVDGFLRL